MKINNKPNYANDYRYIVARTCDGELWFWGAWNEFELAMDAAREIDGTVIDTDED